MAKEYLSSKSIPYQEFDVSRDKAALEEMVRLTGQMGVPVIVIDGYLSPLILWTNYGIIKDKLL
jgi:glutaredoxin